MPTPDLPYDPAELRTLALSDTGFIFDPRTGHSYSANATGLATLAAMKDGLDPAAIATKLRAEFKGGAAVEDDVAGFVDLLRELGLVRARSAP
ncbi:MAG: PqqD family peptide modification chaperone [Deltaproteobacteria bacterium]|nr:PqqD family peptide modification chaperone [Deltaproteobacteria bacterium]